MDDCANDEAEKRRAGLSACRLRNAIGESCEGPFPSGCPGYLTLAADTEFRSTLGPLPCFTMAESGTVLKFNSQKIPDERLGDAAGRMK